MFHKEQLLAMQTLDIVHKANVFCYTDVSLDSFYFFTSL